MELPSLLRVGFCSYLLQLGQSGFGSVGGKLSTIMTISCALQRDIDWLNHTITVSCDVIKGPNHIRRYLDWASHHVWLKHRETNNLFPAVSQCISRLSQLLQFVPLNKGGFIMIHTKKYLYLYDMPHIHCLQSCSFGNVMIVCHFRNIEHAEGYE